MLPLSSGIKGQSNRLYESSRRTDPSEFQYLRMMRLKHCIRLYPAGHDGADGMKVLEVSAKAAIGGVTDTATAAERYHYPIECPYKLDVSEAEKNIRSTIYYRPAG